MFKSNTYSRNLAPVAFATVCGIVACAAAVTGSKVYMGLVAVLPLLAVSLFMLRNPDFIYWGIVLTASFKDHLGVPAGGINVRAYNALALIGLGWLGVAVIKKTEGKRLRLAGLVLPFFVPLLLLLCSKLSTIYLLFSLPPGMSKFFCAKYAVFAAMLFCTAYVTAFMTTSVERLHKALVWWLHIANVVLVIAFVQIVLSNGFGFHYVHHRDVIFFGRPYSVFREPDVLGSFFGATFMMVVSLLVFRAKFVSRRYLQATLVAHGLFLIILFVRAAWIGVVFSILVFLAAGVQAGYHKRLAGFFKRMAFISLIGLMLVPVAAPGFAAKLVGRFASLGQPSEEGASEYRMRELNAMTEKTMHSDGISLLFGHGDFAWTYWAPYLLGENYDRAAVEKMQKGGSVLIHAGFCMAFTVFFDNGLVGLLLMGSFFVTLFILYFKRSRKYKDPASQALLSATFLPVVCILICFQFSYDPITPFFWVLIGLFLAACLHVAAKEGLNG